MSQYLELALLLGPHPIERQLQGIASESWVRLVVEGVLHHLVGDGVLGVGEGRSRPLGDLRISVPQQTFDPQSVVVTGEDRGGVLLDRFLDSIFQRLECVLLFLFSRLRAEMSMALPVQNLILTPLTNQPSVDARILLEGFTDPTEVDLSVHLPGVLELLQRLVVERNPRRHQVVHLTSNVL